MQIIGVAGVVRYGEAAVTDGHLAFTKRQREEAQLVQQTSQSLRRETQVETPPHTDRQARMQRTATISYRARQRVRLRLRPSSAAQLTHPNIGFCGDDLVVVKIHHLGSSIRQGGVPAATQHDQENQAQ